MIKATLDGQRVITIFDYDLLPTQSSATGIIDKRPQLTQVKNASI